MNKKQLSYIRERQQNGTYIIPTVSMRKKIDDSIIEELETIYKPSISGVETDYKESLNDISLPNDFLDDTNMVSVINTYGGSALTVYLYLHEKMCQGGYCIVWNDTQKKVMRNILAGVYDVEKRMIDDMISEFIKLGLLYVISDGEKNYLTSCYQVYIFERVSAKRLRDRIYKKNSKMPRGENKLKVETTMPVFKDESIITTTVYNGENGTTTTKVFEDEEAERFIDQMLQEFS